MAMRSHYCGLVTEALNGQTVSLCGWVNRRRDHGGVIFIDLRDREGYVQVVCDPDRPEMFKVAENVRNEFCIQVKGLVRARPEGTTNEGLKSGKIEVLCHELIVLNESVTPPFQIDDDNLSETTRLTHRVLDLRRPYMQNNLMLRYKVAMEVRKYLDENGFVDIETPMLTKSTPEGARDYLVPSRVHDGQFFALPQSPQLFKQLLMVAGYDRYYQITKCFRDEDLRADRQPEFTQIDIETSFLSEEEIRDMFQGMIKRVFTNTIGVDLGEFPVMTYQDAMHIYGSDKPDLRVKLQFTEVTDVMGDVDFKVFSGAANMKGGRVVALRVPNGSVEGGGISRGEIDAYTEFVKIYGAKGLAYIRVNDLSKGRDGLQSPIVKNIHDAALAAVLEREDSRDAFVSNDYASLDALPAGAVVGTSSLRRQALIAARYPHLVIKPLRGNLDTRLRKLDEGQYAAIVLAAAGLVETRLPHGTRVRARAAPDSRRRAAQGAAASPSVALPPAVQIEINTRPWPFSFSSFAAVAAIRAPVAANGWPAASDEPLTLSLVLSMAPSAASRPNRSLQYSSDSHAASVASTTEANASWIS